VERDGDRQREDDGDDDRDKPIGENKNPG